VLVTYFEVKNQKVSLAENFFLKASQRVKAAPLSGNNKMIYYRDSPAFFSTQSQQRPPSTQRKKEKNDGWDRILR
jgi:hypothetical protein